MHAECIPSKGTRCAAFSFKRCQRENVSQDEIIDETDNFENNEHSVPVVRRPGRDRPDVSSYLAMFEHKIRDQNKLSPSEVQVSI